MADAITVEQYKELADAYARTHSVTEAGKAIGASRQLASRYINRGDPRRNLPPIRERLERVTKAANKEADRIVIKELAKRSAITMRDIVDKGKELALKVIEVRLEKPELFDESVGAFVKSIHGVESALDGRPSETTKVVIDDGRRSDILAELERIEIEKRQEAVAAGDAEPIERARSASADSKERKTA